MVKNLLVENKRNCQMLQEVAMQQQKGQVGPIRRKVVLRPEDNIDQFMREYTKKHPAGTIQTNTLYMLYKSFCAERNIEVLATNSFSIILSFKGFTKKKKKTAGVLYTDITLA
jgi:hypothetical protein